MSRRGFLAPDINTLFFWSPKCACTTLFNLMEMNFGKNYKHWQEISMPWQECVAEIERNKLASVVITRHPTPRIVSGYINKFIIFKGKRITSVGEMEGFSSQFFKHYTNLFGITTDQSIMTFEEFLDTLEHLHGKRQNHDKNSIEKHWDTQVPAGLLASGFRYDHVIRVEQIKSDFPKVCENLGLKYRYIHNNATQRPTTVEDESYLGNIPANEIPTSNLSISRFLNNDNLDRINKIFKVDYEMFGYDRDDYRS